MVYFFIVLLRSQLEQSLSVGNSSEALCNFNITEHACSSVRLFFVNCESQRKILLLQHYHPDINLHKLWVFALFLFKFFRQGYTSHSQKLGHTTELLTGRPKDIPSRGLEAFLPKSFCCTRPGSWDIRHHGKSNPTISHKVSISPLEFCVKPKRFFQFQAPNNSNPSLSHALEALGNVRIANFSQAQLQSNAFVSSWFQTKIRPFLASPSPNFLFCLSSKNFSCHTYQTV